MNSPSMDIALFLESRGVGTLALATGSRTDWALAYAGEPSTPDSVITIYDTGGEGPDTDELDVSLPTIQVRARALSHEAAYARQVMVRDLLIRDPVECETSRFTMLVMTSDILTIGRDESQRFLLTANYRSRRTDKESADGRQ